MANLLAGRTPPFEVAVGPHPFVDYRFVHAGQPRWLDADGAAIHYFGLGSPDHVHSAHAGIPHGIDLQVQSASRSEPILTCTEPWEHQNGTPTIIYDGGVYRMWYFALSPDFWDPAEASSIGWGPDYGYFLCYAESDDGFEWRKPALGLYEWQGHDTNIVFGRELAGEAGLHGSSVFLDPVAPAHERYRQMYMGRVSADVVRRWVREHPNRVDPWISIPDRHRGMFMATSPDGIRWTTHPDPVLIYLSDTCNVVDWNNERQCYVWYSRGWTWDRRTITRTESPDVFNWQLPTPVLTVPPVQVPVTDIYTSGKVAYPGDSTTHLMFPTLYDRSLDTTTLAVASSPDDLAWNWVPGGPVLEPGPTGSFDEGCLFSAKGLALLPGGQIGAPYTGYNVPHKYPRHQLGTQSAWAMWPQGRIAGLVCDSEGGFDTPALALQGNELRVNVRTSGDGELRVSVLIQSDRVRYDYGGEEPPPNSGPSKWTPRVGHGGFVELCTSRPINGDHLAIPVHWEGESIPKISSYGPVVLRFQMRHATLFGFELDA